MHFTSAPHINMDHAATTPPEPAVIDAVCRCMADCNANPSAAYSDAGASRKVIREAKQAVSALLSCTPQEIHFTSGGTEANNWALFQAAGKHVVVSAMEHKSVLLAAAHFGCTVTQVLPDANGIVTPEAVQAALRPDTAMISVMLANNETGVIQPVKEIGLLANSRGIPFHCDAVQATGHIPVDVNACHIDYLSASAHKLYGPRGVGLLYVRNGLSPAPLLAGGGQEQGLRAGTENVPGICGFGVAATLAAEDLSVRASREAALRDLLVQRVLRAVPEAREVCGASERLPGIAALILPAVQSEAVIAAMDLAGICLSGGAACASHDGKPSHVLLSLGFSADEARRFVRISLGRHTTEEEILRTADTLIETLQATAPQLFSR